MGAILLAILAYFLNAVTTVVDKYLLRRSIPDPALYAFLTGILSIFVLPFFLISFAWPGWTGFVLDILAGVIFLAATLVLFMSLKEGEASRVAPIIGGLTPVVILGLSLLVGLDSPALTQAVACLLLVVGGILLALEKRKRLGKVTRRNNLKKWGLLFLAAFLYGGFYVLLDYAYSFQPFLPAFVWSRMGSFLAAFLLLGAIRKNKGQPGQIFEPGRRINLKASGWLVANKAIAGIAFIILNYAVYLGSALVVNSLQGVQYAALFLLTLIISVTAPKILKEKLSAGVIVQKIIGIFLIGAGLLTFSGAQKPADWSDKIEWGLTYSKYFAEKSDLDWQEVYLAMLDDLRPAKLRVAVYWPDIEAERGQYDFSDYDWMVKEAEKRGTRLILVVGRKVPRWPECHVPEWALGMDDAAQQEALLAFIHQVVTRYQNSPALYLWQVENEPFLNFGECPQWPTEFLDREIALVRELDNQHSIMITDSGELSFWLPAAERADIFGTTMYRIIWNEQLGYYHYPLSEKFFWLKANLVRLFHPDKPIVVCELQGEYWGPKQPYETPLELEMREFGPEELENSIELARRVGFGDVYLWGAEWWYWLEKNHGDDRFWEKAKQTIAGGRN